jgi:hypothetical protein
MRSSTLSKVLRHGFVGSLGIGLLLGGLSPAAKAQVAKPGTDYLITPRGGATYNFDFSGIKVPISFSGLPIGSPTSTPPDGGYTAIGNILGVADTVVNRDSTVVNSGDTTPIEIIGLSLVSDGPVNIPGLGSSDIFVGLQKYYSGSGATSTGTMTIFDANNVKTWDSNFSVNAFAFIAPAGTLIPSGTDFVKKTIQSITAAPLPDLFDCPTAAIPTLHCYLFSKSNFKAFGEPWSPTPNGGQILGKNLKGPDSDQDFYLTEAVIHDAGDGTIHKVTPTPGPLPVLGAPFAFASVRRLKKMSSDLKGSRLGQE